MSAPRPLPRPDLAMRVRLPEQPRQRKPQPSIFCQFWGAHAPSRAPFGPSPSGMACVRMFPTERAENEEMLLWEQESYSPRRVLTMELANFSRQNA